MKNRASIIARRAAPGIAILLMVSGLMSPPALAVSGSAIDPFVFHVAIFVLAAFVGYFVVWSVTPALHTPLMSVTNAISAVVVIGAIIAATAETRWGSDVWLPRSLGAAALFFSAINIVGGFMVTRRMVAMYRSRKPKRDGG